MTKAKLLDPGASVKFLQPNPLTVQMEWLTRESLELVQSCTGHEQGLEPGPPNSPSCALSNLPPCILREAQGVGIPLPFWHSCSESGRPGPPLEAPVRRLLWQVVGPALLGERSVGFSGHCICWISVSLPNNRARASKKMTLKSSCLGWNLSFTPH